MNVIPKPDDQYLGNPFRKYAPGEWEKLQEAAIEQQKAEGQSELTAKTPVLKLRRLSEIKTPPATKWLARGWIPYSEITVLVGEEGIGKSLAWVRWVAAITSGREDSSINLPARKPRDVVVIVTEDNPGEVKARLDVAGADIDRVLMFSSENDGTGNPVFGNTFQGGDMATLDAYMGDEDVDVALVVVDAWVDTVSGVLTLKDGQQARQAMHPWKQLAQKHEAAVILMTHTNRMPTANTRDLMGSTAVLRQKARMVLFAARSPEDKDNGGQHIWIGPDKTNVTGIADAEKYRLNIHQVREPSDDDPGTTATLDAPASAAMTIRALLEEWDQGQRDANRKPTKAESAEEVLRAHVRDANGPVLSSALKDYLREQGFGKTVAEDAMKACGTSAPDGQGGQWVYRLKADGTSCQSSYSEPITQNTRNTRNTRNTEAEEEPVITTIPSLPRLPTSYRDGSEAGTPETPQTCQCGQPLTEHLRRTYGQCFTCQSEATA